MVEIDWAQIILGVAGSGLILFLLNTALADYNQPSLVIDVNRNSVPIDKLGHHEMRYETILKNVGMAKATNVRVAMDYPSGNVSNYRLIFSSENATSSKDANPDTLILNVPRLSPYGTVFVYTAVRDLKAPTFKNISAIDYDGNYVPYNKTYFISASYDQGGSPPVRTDLTFTAYKGLQKTAPFSMVVMTIGSIGSMAKE